MVIVLPLNDTVTQLDDADTIFPSSKLTSYQESYCGMNISAVKGYVTAEFAAELFPSNGKFTVGLGSSPNDLPDIYINGVLCFSTKYSFFVRAFSVSIGIISLVM